MRLEIDAYIHMGCAFLGDVQMALEDLPEWSGEECLAFVGMKKESGERLTVTTAIPTV